MAKKNVKTEQMFQQSKVEKVFSLVKDENGKVRIVMGNMLASRKEFDTFKQADEFIGTKPYELIFNGVEILMRYKNENKSNEIVSPSVEEH